MPRFESLISLIQKEKNLGTQNVLIHELNVCFVITQEPDPVMARQATSSPHVITIESLGEGRLKDEYTLPCFLALFGQEQTLSN